MSSLEWTVVYAVAGVGVVGVVAVAACRGTTVHTTGTIAYRPVGRQQGVLRRNIRVGEHIVSHLLY